MLKVATSILSANFTKLGEEIKAIDKAGSDYIHIDVMDGNFVPNLSFGAGITKQIRPLTNKVFDVHLMVENPESYVLPFQDAGADILTFHVEATKHHDRLISYIKSCGMKVGLALNPSTNEDCLKYLIDKLDLVLVMTVNPGFGGQKFLQSQINKVKNIKEKYIKDKNIDLSIDGGVDNTNSNILKASGANVLISGSYIFSNVDYQEGIKAIKNS